jgi:protein involved in polysaccharide export with SLBB domain
MQAALYNDALGAGSFSPRSGSGSRDLLRGALSALALLFALLLPTAASAQVLEPGDELELRIPGAKAKTVILGADGTLDLESYGSVAIGGKSIEGARDALRKHLAQYLKNAGTVQLKLIAAGRLVLVTGKVTRPGMVKVAKTDDLWQAINKAGGPADGADLTRVVVARKSPGAEPVETSYNVAAYLAGSRTVQLPIVQTGDTVFVPSGAGLDASPGAVFLSDDAVSNKVFVLGSVTRPGMYNRSKELSVLAAIALAGGPVSGADLSNIRMTTSAGVRRLDLVGWLEGEVRTPPLLPSTGGVIVYVPAAAAEGTADSGLGRHANVLGGVNGQGKIAIRGPTPLVELIGMAGGVNENGDLEEVYVVHRGAMFTIATRYDVEDFLERGGLLSNVMVNPGDAVYVTSSMGTEVWQAVVGIISNLAQISSAFAIFATVGAP